MMNAISQASQALNVTSVQNSSVQALSSEQMTVIEETLAQFDADSLNSTDALSIVESFSEAGITPGKALEDAMSVAGFDARSVGELARGENAGQSMPPPPRAEGDVQALNISDDQLSELSELLTSYYDEGSSEDKESLLATIQQMIQEAAPESGLVDVLA